jgi:hypothetical protein
VTRYYSIDEANATLPEVDRILIALRDQREELIARRDKVVELSPDDDSSALAAGVAEQVRLLRLSMQGLIDQMQAGVARLVELDVTLRDIATGLIDFPALVSGRPIWLCWRLGEGDIESWHAHDEGFDSRRPLSDLPAGSSHGSGTPAA